MTTVKNNWFGSESKILLLILITTYFMILIKHVLKSKTKFERLDYN